MLKRIFLFSGAFLFQSLCFAGPVEMIYQRSLMKNQSLQQQGNIEAHEFEQLLDHDNPEAGTFLQRYWVDSSYAESTLSPVFLYICGEGACGPGYLNGAIREYAKKYHARLVALEHRYYGKSIPVAKLDREGLAHLSTGYALNDLVYFQVRMGLENYWMWDWVAFGGSYPGSLSAFYRLKYPEMVLGSLASSAPVMAKEDFYEYDRHVTEVLGPECSAKVRRAVSDVEEAIRSNPEAFDEIKENFQAEDIKDPVDFLYLLADLSAAAVQGGKHEMFCQLLDTGYDSLTGYALFAREVYVTLGVKAVDFTPQAAMEEDAEALTNRIGIRQWYYQSCMEYGYWQNAHPNPEQSTRSSLINNDYHRNVCKRLFGITEPAPTEKTNEEYYYPLMDSSVSRIFFSNGANDPWSNLSLTEKNGNANNPNLNYFLIDGAAHCEDLRAPKASDSSALKQVRSLFDQQLNTWLNEEN